MPGGSVGGMSDSQSQASAHPPMAPKRPGKPRAFHGDAFADPWEWLRDTRDPRVLGHLRAENAWTDRVLGHTRPLQEQLVSEFRAHTVETDVTAPVRRRRYWYYTRTTEGQAYPAHWRVAVDPDAPRPPAPRAGAPLPGEQLVVDEAAWAEGQDFFRLASLTPSPDERLAAWGRDTSGGERYTLSVTDIASSRVVDQAVTNVGYGLAWSADSTTVFYTRMNDAWRANQVWAHRVGSAAGDDRLVLQEDDERFELAVGASRDGAWIVLTAYSTNTTEAWLIPAANPTAPPRSVAGRTEGVEYDAEPAGDHLLLTHTAATREGTLAAAPLPRPDAWPADGPIAPPPTWVALRSPGEGERILGVDAYAGFAVLSLRTGGRTAVEVLRRTRPLAPAPLAADVLGSLYAPGAPVDVEWPVRTLSAVPLPYFEAAEVRIGVESPVHPPQVEDVDPATGERTLRKRLEVPGWDPDRYAEELVWAPARDGRTRIPVSLVHRRDAKPDGTAPGWLYGYGSYEVSADPNFSRPRLSVLERGVVWAIAHVRGGGELGRAWYEDGRLERKPHTFSDFVDVADWLVSSGWVAPARLAAEGGSAGGLLMGAAANLAPGRFRAVLAEVPFVDALTTILDPSLPLTVGEWEEWGNPVESEQIYRVMKGYSPYENVRDGARYPAVLAVTSLNDTRVFPVEPTKWIQRLREAATNDPVTRPILERIHMVAGHGGRSGRYAAWEERAEQVAFVLDQLGAA